MLLEQSIFLLMLFFLISWLYISLGIYFIPVIIAFVRKHKNVLAISILNLTTGWTFVGWLAALLWSLNSDVIDDSDD